MLVKADHSQELKTPQVVVGMQYAYKYEYTLN